MRPAPSSNSAYTNLEEAATTRLRVLVVDDEPAVRAGLEVWLTQRDLEIATAGNLRSAIERVLDFHPDAILLDVKLGEEDGLNLIHLLRDAHLDVPCVVLTAHAGPLDGFKARDLDVFSLIEKPSSPNEIAAALRRAAGSKKRNAILQGRSPHVADTMRVIQATFQTKGLSLEAIARAVNVSTGHLSKSFRREIGCSVIAFIHKKRVAHAVHLLRTTNMSVKAIADECGYHGSSELHRHFSRENGASPLGYRSRESRPISGLDNRSLE